MTTANTTSTATVGQIVTWTIRNCFVERIALLAALEKVGIKAHVKETRPSTYLRRAIAQAYTDKVIRKIGEDERSIAYALVNETKNLQLNSYTGRTEEAIKLHKQSGEIEFAHNSGQLRVIREAIHKNQGGLLSAEIGAVCKYVVTTMCDGISLRDTGGVYFVPESRMELLDKLEQALATVIPQGSTARLHRLRVITGARESKDILALYH
jgi:hypothetical protein